MATVGRNDPCPCGSGAKAKRCCGVRRGPSESALAKAFLVRESRRAALSLAGADEAELEALWNELFDLPNEDLDLLVPLPQLLTPEIERLRHALVVDDPEEAEAALPPVLEVFDTPVVRARLAGGVIALRDRGGISDRLAAMALIDLAMDSTAFLKASLIATIDVLAGAARTPAGLVLATH